MIQLKGHIMSFNKSILSPIKAWKYLFKESVTVEKEDIFLTPRTASDRYRGFHINHQDKCTGCGTCASICPTAAISMIPIDGREIKDGANDQLPAFDYGRCSFCGLCVDICTSGSLGMTKEYIHVTTDPNTFIFIPDELGIHHKYYPDGYTRDEVSELLDLERYEMEEVAEDIRVHSFMELIKGFSKEMALKESSRCVECGICTETCPAHMHIPEYINAIYSNDLQAGLEWLYKTNPLPNVCGRICTHRCKNVCVIANRGEAVSIRWLKRYIVDAVTDQDYEKMILSPVVKQNNKQVAIAGSGPAGLSAAYYLRTMGYQVTVYETRPLLGGVIRYGAPEYRLPDDKVNRDIEIIKKIGVKFITDTTVGRDITVTELHYKYDAIFLATGFWKPRKLTIPNNDHKDVHTSLDFLSKAREYTRGNDVMPDIHKKVVVIGGGDVSFDVARTLVRFQLEKYGEHHVTFIARKSEEYLAASDDEIEEGKEEGVIYNLNASPTEIIVDHNGLISGIKVSACETRSENGKIKTYTNHEETCIIEATQVFFAVGSDPDFDYLLERLGSNLHVDKNKLKVLENGQIENHEYLFAGGDIVNGPDIISAIADGHKAAKGIDEYLRK